MQLHLSRDCNRPDLAQAAARALGGDAADVAVHTADQHSPGATLHLTPWPPAGFRPRRARRKPTPAADPRFTQGWLPGLLDGPAAGEAV